MAKQGAKAAVPRLRFPEFRTMAAWREVPLERVAQRTSTKNSDGHVTRVLTNSAEFGVLDQRDYFDKDIATAGKVDGSDVAEELQRLLGAPWDDELEVFRHAGEGAPVRWLTDAV